MRKLKMAARAAKRMVTVWDYSNLDSIFRGDGVVDFQALLVRFVVFFVHIVAILTIPISCFVVVWVNKEAESRNLKSWVCTMRRDKGFFHQHYYIEIKDHINEHRDAYSTIMNWR